MVLIDSASWYWNTYKGSRLQIMVYVAGRIIMIKKDERREKKRILIVCLILTYFFYFYLFDALVHVKKTVLYMWLYTRK